MSGDEQSAGKCSGVGQGGGKFGEPWRLIEDCDIDYGGDVAESNHGKGAVAGRIVACVNACAGMEDPVAEIGALRGWCRDCIWSNAASDPATEPCAGIDHCENAGADKHADYPRAVECSGYRSMADDFPVLRRFLLAYRAHLIQTTFGNDSGRVKTSREFVRAYEACEGIMTPAGQAKDGG